MKIINSQKLMMLIKITKIINSRKQKIRKSEIRKSHFMILAALVYAISGLRIDDMRFDVCEPMLEITEARIKRAL